MRKSIYDPKGLAGAPAEENGGDRTKEDLDIEPEGPVIDIFEIESNPIGKVFQFVAARDLPEAGHSWGDTESAALGVGGHGEGFIGGEGAGSDETHLAEKDVEELGEFIEGGEAEEVADFGDPRIFFDFKDWATHFVKGFKFGVLHFCITDHGAKLVHGERVAMETTALLEKKGGARRFEPDGNPDHGK